MSVHLQDLEVILPAVPGALADLGQVLGRVGVSLEGGGVFTHDGRAVAHYLVDDGAKARAAVIEASVGTVVVREVIITRLDQNVPGQLGALARRLGDAGVNVLVQYSDHAGNLILIPDEDSAAGCREVIAHWEQRPSAP